MTTTEYQEGDLVRSKRHPQSGLTGVILMTSWAFAGIGEPSVQMALVNWDGIRSWEPSEDLTRARPQRAKQSLERLPPSSPPPTENTTMNTTELNMKALNALRISRVVTDPENEELIVRRALKLEDTLPADLLEKLVPLFYQRRDAGVRFNEHAKTGTIADAQNVALHVLDGFWRETQTAEDALIDLIGAVLAIPTI